MGKEPGGESLLREDSVMASGPWVLGGAVASTVCLTLGLHVIVSWVCRSGGYVHVTGWGVPCVCVCVCVHAHTCLESPGVG